MIFILCYAFCNSCTVDDQLESISYRQSIVNSKALFYCGKALWHLGKWNNISPMIQPMGIWNQEAPRSDNFKLSINISNKRPYLDFSIALGATALLFVKVNGLSVMLLLASS